MEGAVRARSTGILIAAKRPVGVISGLGVTRVLSFRHNYYADPCDRLTVSL